MAENKNAKTPTDGGAAFPVAHSYLIQSGMSLRDYFAAKAMAAVAIENYTESEIAVWAYKMADAMLAERVKE